MKNDYRLSVHRLAACGIIAAIYAVLTIATSSFAYGPIQFRIAEASAFIARTFWMASRKRGRAMGLSR